LHCDLPSSTQMIIFTASGLQVDLPQVTHARKKKKQVIHAFQDDQIPPGATI